jgi:hypothetical protein
MIFKKETRFFKSDNKASELILHSRDNARANIIIDIMIKRKANLFKHS